MSNTILSAHMGLPVPVVGVDPGPDYASNVNGCFAIIDQHNHASGSGVQINPDGININADLPFNSNNATSLRSSRYVSQASPITGISPDLTCVYVSGVDLYYNDGNGNQIQITSVGGVAGTPGSIGGLVSPASATYVPLSKTFVWQSDSGIPANLDCGSITIHDVAAGTNGVTIGAFSGTAAYTIGLPTNVPASTLPLLMDNSGTLSTAQLASAQLAAGSVGTTQLQSAAVTTANIASGNITSALMASNVNFPGKAVQEAGSNVVVQNTNTTNSFAILRGTIGPSGTLISGEGFTISHTVTGVYGITFTTLFGDTPVVTATLVNLGIPRFLTLSGSATNGFQCVVTDASATGHDNEWSFIAVGQRA